MAQVSYMILQRVSPVTHSIGNCLKRVIVIVASVLVFHNPMSRQNMIGESYPSPYPNPNPDPAARKPSRPASHLQSWLGHRLRADQDSI